MKEIQRFDMRGNTWPSDDGSIVSYKDHAAIVAEKDTLIDSLQEQVRALADEGSAIKQAFKKAANTVEECELYGELKYLVEPSEYEALADAIEETPATDAALREIRAQARAEGIHFAANRLLAAWESGFVNDTPAAAHDISGAILSAVEFLPNAFEAEFKRDYADEVRARIRAGEKS